MLKSRLSWIGRSSALSDCDYTTVNFSKMFAINRPWLVHETRQSYMLSLMPAYKIDRFFFLNIIDIVLWSKKQVSMKPQSKFKKIHFEVSSAKMTTI